MAAIVDDAAITLASGATDPQTAVGGLDDGAHAAAQDLGRAGGGIDVDQVAEAGPVAVRDRGAVELAADPQQARAVDHERVDLVVGQGRRQRGLRA